MKKNRTPIFRADEGTGFSLMELVVAVAMFAVMVVSLLGIFAKGYLYARKMRMAAQAHFFAQQLIEEYFNESLVFSTASNITETPCSDPNFNYTINFTHPLYVPEDGYSHPRLAEVNVTVYWHGQTGQQRSFSLVTYIANST